MLWRVRRHSNVTKGGRIPSYSALAVVGDGVCSAGWGRGKAPDVGTACFRAREAAKKNMISVWKYQDRTLGESVRAQWRGVRCQIKTYPPSLHGLTHGTAIWRGFFTSFGLSDVGGRWFGTSRNPESRLKVMFKCVEAAQHPVEVADKLGQKMFYPRGIHRKGKAASWAWSY
eukprot:TRINITY_DN3940_c0_g1_i1.p1 TRINITY_DN3940_c0_g1~~TRINITY_DN3940_c0_g1_i1.p1  ORF type:complete len:172 (+),score=24.96 TRINITY_DN3940_c0_g1_i1:449-964(+)